MDGIKQFIFVIKRQCVVYCEVNVEFFVPYTSVRLEMVRRSFLSCSYKIRGPPLWSSGQSFWLQIQRSRVRSPALPDFLSSSGSGTGSTQPREVN